LLIGLTTGKSRTDQPAEDHYHGETTIADLAIGGDRSSWITGGTCAREPGIGTETPMAG
jgi:hypothetical protein